MKILFTLTAAVLSLALNFDAIALASENQESSRDVDKIVVLVKTKKALKTAQIDNLQDALRAAQFQLKHPDKVINPKMVEAKYKGLSLNNILAKANLTDDQLRQLSAETITFIGRDSYSVAMPLGDALGAQATLTGYENDERLDWRRGAPFLAFLDAGRAGYLAEPSWWAWWVSAIVVGNPEGSLTLGTKQMTAQQIAKICAQTSDGTLNYPRGRRKIEPRKNNKGRLTQCPLTTLPLWEQSADKQKTGTLVVSFLTGQQQKIDKPEDYALVSKFNDKPIDVQLGGPFQLCKLKGKQECRYFVTAIRGEN
ncbi:MAG: Oxidoreductase molybdopterin binding domain [Pseudomonadota bacterium]|jgi:signal recognition particle subunit SEC65